MAEMALMALSMVSWEAFSEVAAVCRSSSASSLDTCLVSRASAKYSLPVFTRLSANSALALIIASSSADTISESGVPQRLL